MNELFQIQPQWARAHYLRSNPLAIGVEMPDRPIRAERPFTPLLLLLAIVYLMAVLTPTSASAARLDSAEALVFQYGLMDGQAELAATERAAKRPQNWMRRFSGKSS